MTTNTEIEAYSSLLFGHLIPIIRRLRQIPADRWEWQIEPPSPSPRILAEHSWSWLASDRRHILGAKPDDGFRLPDPPNDQQAMCGLLAEEMAEWKTLLNRMTPEILAEPRLSFGWQPYTVRGLICHMIQNLIYKHGQLSTLYFALGLDGTEPYTAPFPNYDYDLLISLRECPLFRAVLDKDIAAIPTLIESGEDIEQRDEEGHTPLHIAAYMGSPETVELLVGLGADVNARLPDGLNPLMIASYYGHEETVITLLACGADVAKVDGAGRSAFDYAEDAGHASIAEILGSNPPE
jgi:hypothetical protein